MNCEVLQYNRAPCYSPLVPVYGCATIFNTAMEKYLAV